MSVWAEKATSLGASGSPTRQMAFLASSTLTREAPAASSHSITKRARASSCPEGEGIRASVFRSSPSWGSTREA